MGNRDKVRSVRASVKQTAKGTFGRIIKHLRSHEDISSPQNPRKSLPSLWSLAVQPSVSGPLQFFGPQLVHIDSPTTEDPDSPRRPSHASSKGILLSRPSNNENNAAIEKRAPATISKELNNQFAELCSLVHQQLKEDTTLRKQRAHTSSNNDETDDDLDPTLRESLLVPIKSFKSAESLKEIETPLRTQKLANIQSIHTPPIFKQTSTIAIRQILPDQLPKEIRSVDGISIKAPSDTRSPAELFKCCERLESSTEEDSSPSPNTTIAIHHVHVLVKEVGEDDGSSAKATCETIAPSESLKCCERLQLSTEEDSSPSPNTLFAMPDGYVNCVLVGIDSTEHINQECIDLPPTPRKDLEEGFRGFLTLPLPSLGSPVRVHGTDFYEYPSVPATPPPCYDIEKDESLNATCALYDSSYSVRSVQSTGTGTGTHDSVGLSCELIRELERARVAEEMHHRGLTLPQWTTFPAKSITPVIDNGPKLETDRSEELRNSEVTNITRGTDYSELTDTTYGNGIEQSKAMDWWWEANSRTLLRLQEQPPFTVEEVPLKS